MIGNPFPRNIKWADVTENSNDPLADVDSTAYAYDSTVASGQPYRAITAAGTPGFNREIAPYQGVWIKQNIQNASTSTINLPFEK